MKPPGGPMSVTGRIVCHIDVERNAEIFSLIYLHSFSISAY